MTLTKCLVWRASDTGTKYRGSRSLTGTGSRPGILIAPLPPDTVGEIPCKGRPVGMPSEGDFELAQVLLLEPDEGEILMRNTNLFKGENFGKMLVRVGPDPAV